jgi:alpha,alpha-trehalase
MKQWLHIVARPKPKINRARNASIALLAIALGSAGYSAPKPQDKLPGLQPIKNYIATGWDRLTRSLDNCETFADPKLSGHPTLYLPFNYPETAAVQLLPAKCGVQIAHLARVISAPGEIDSAQINPLGLLYLPEKYVVPGGRFNEMYGWDSYFIVRGLIEDGRIDLARGMVDNFLFEEAYYRSVLNANRTYYLTRSQPPFLTSMILAVNKAEKKSGHQDRDWLYRAAAEVSRDDELWSRGEHLAGDTGLSRYFDYGQGPAPESIEGEPGYYAKVAAFFLAHPELDHGYVVSSTAEHTPNRVIGPAFPVPACDSAAKPPQPDCDPAGHVHLSAEYYKSDRAMRESGFDISFRFGPYGAESDHFAAVCLNSLLYKQEMDIAAMWGSLGNAKQEAHFRAAAAARKKQIQKYLWDEQRGMFFDYNFATHQRSSYDYLTTFYPLWVGVATPQQARAVEANLKLFEQAGGLAMSRNDSGVQWDYPYEWAPTVLIAVEGLRRYGFSDDANRISYNFLSTVAENFRRDGTIREKYNAVTRSSEANVTAGYQQNVIGFGWTNGVFLCLLHALPADAVDRLAKEQQQ